MYRIAMYIGTAGLFVLRDGTRGKRAQQILQLIEGQMTGAVLLPVGVTLFFAWVDFAFRTLNNMPKLGMWPYTVLAIAALIAGGKGVTTGFQMIEEWTGTSTQHNAMATVMGTQMAARAVSKGLHGGKSLLGAGVNAITGGKKKQKIQAAMGNGSAGGSLKNPNQTLGGTGGLNEAGLPIKENGKLDTDRMQNGQIMPKGQSHGRKTAHIAAGIGRVSQVVAHPKQTAVAAGTAAVNGTKQAVWDKGLKQYGQNVAAGFTKGTNSAQMFRKRHTKPNLSVPPINPYTSNGTQDSADPNATGITDFKPKQPTNVAAGMGGSQAQQTLRDMKTNPDQVQAKVGSQSQPVAQHIGPMKNPNVVGQQKPKPTIQKPTQMATKAVNVGNKNKSAEFDIDAFAKSMMHTK